MNTKILTLLTAFMLLTPSVAMAANTFTVNYNVQVTSFAVEINPNLNPAQTALNFTGQPGNSNIKPDGTNSGAVAWGKVNNTGDTALTFNISATETAGVTLRVAGNTAMTGAVTVTGTPASPPEWASIAGGASADIWAEADFAAGATKSSATATIGAT